MSSITSKKSFFLVNDPSLLEQCLRAISGSFLKGVLYFKLHRSRKGAKRKKPRDAVDTNSIPYELLPDYR